VCGPISIIIAYLLTVNYGYLNDKMTIPEAARSKATLAGPNPSGGMDVSLLTVVYCHIEVSAVS
jgi:hypothetical protein